MDLGIAGKVALVTGASKGIGRGIAAALVAEGVQVALTSRDAARIEAAAVQVGGIGLVHDSSNLDGVPALLGEVAERLGPVDILVCNTGGPAADIDSLGFGRDQWQAAYEQLVLFPMALVEAAAPGMRSRGWGRILNVASTTVREPSPILMLSNSHRAAAIAAWKTLARQLAPDGVTLNSVLPGRIATDRIAELAGSIEVAEAAARDTIPAGRLGTVEEFAAASVFLCSEPAAYITGTTLTIDGGVTQSIF